LLLRKDREREREGERDNELWAGEGRYGKASERSVELE
jgi:hypothetical protein